VAEVSLLLVPRNSKPKRADIWSRYNMFIVLYPVGILSEMWLVYQVIQPSKARNPIYQYLLWAGLLIYAPGQYCTCVSFSKHICNRTSSSFLCSLRPHAVPTEQSRAEEA
jgi:hypothetical protein